jgi:DNA-binding transcriptional MocR family regulator
MGMTADLPPESGADPPDRRRHLENGLPVDASEIIVTTGATEALNLCLQAGAAGSAIAVESPTYYALLQAIERMGMQVVEIDTDPVQGINRSAGARHLSKKAWRPAWSCPTSRTRWASR